MMYHLNKTQTTSLVAIVCVIVVDDSTKMRLSVGNVFISGSLQEGVQPAAKRSFTPHGGQPA